MRTPALQLEDMTFTIERGAGAAGGAGHARDAAGARARRGPPLPRGLHPVLRVRPHNL